MAVGGSIGKTMKLPSRRMTPASRSTFIDRMIVRSAHPVAVANSRQSLVVTLVL